MIPCLIAVGLHNWCILHVPREDAESSGELEWLREDEAAQNLQFTCSPGVYGATYVTSSQNDEEWSDFQNVRLVATIGLPTHFQPGEHYVQAEDAAIHWDTDDLRKTLKSAAETLAFQSLDQPSVAVVWRHTSEKVLPKDLRSVVARITAVGELGRSEWYEVIYYDDQERHQWCSYAGSDTFKVAGEHVIEWCHADECLPKQLDMSNASPFRQQLDQLTDKYPEMHTVLMAGVQKPKEDEPGIAHVLRTAVSEGYSDMMIVETIAQTLRASRRFAVVECGERG